MKVNPKPVEACPISNPERRNIRSVADSINLQQDVEENKKEFSEAVNNNNEDVYQKKIMPWEMMLETDVELTKDLVKAKVKDKKIKYYYHYYYYYYYHNIA